MGADDLGREKQERMMFLLEAPNSPFKPTAHANSSARAGVG
jgi:hypothetical protein